jgi:hypothetical protein
MHIRGPVSNPRPVRNRAGGMFLITLCVAACSEPGSPETSAPSVVDSAGVRVVTSPADRIDRPMEVTLELPAHLRLGVVEGDEAVQFFAPNGAARLSDGRLVVSESGTRLRLFDGEGRFVRWIGALGDGPREFAIVTSMGVLDGDTIAIYDGRRRRIVLFNPEGGFIREAAVQLPESFLQVRSTRFLPDGRLLVEAGNPGLDQQGAAERRERTAAILFDRDGADPRILDEAEGMVLRLETVGEGQGGPARVLMANVTPTFHPLTRFAASRDGVDRWDGARFEVRRLNDTGALREIVRVDRPARPVTADIIRAWEEEGPGANVAPQLREIREQALGSRMFADSLPHFQVAQPAPDGSLWLGEYTGHTGGLPTRWWRVAPDGDLAGFLDLPEDFRVLAFEEGEVLGVERDELDVPYLVGYRLR